ncbi:hypothetical protein BD626DRAFT_483536 [Schizophyllum amplum]|uniref:Uncharacterized protein n=1 Tax=Schizophyllum amplum TaxID=97359 RepID=A0A550CPL1_9AGAR|nr:hypothetical protein BD626DRAFT_483536 [Auriculariopsis ampla]
MDRATSIVAALEAGKLPSQSQISAFMRWLDESGLTQAKPEGQDTLSVQGRKLLDDVRGVLQAYQKLGERKNHDDLLEQTLWHLGQADISSSSTATSGSVDTDEAANDAKAAASALRTVLKVVWESASSETSFLLQDFTSFLRLGLADVAEAVQSAAGSTKESLRTIDQEVQDGKRTTLGRDKERLEEEKDPKVAFAHGMDTLKDAGVTGIGATQNAAEKAQEGKDQASERLRTLYDKICERAQKDEAYRNDITTIVDIAEKWVNSAIDSTAGVRSNSLSSFVDDPTPEQHLHKALDGAQKMLERFAGDKSLNDLFSKTRVCARDIREDDNLRTWFDQFFAHTRKVLKEPDYSQSSEAKGRRKELRRRWHELSSGEGDSAQKWKADWDDISNEAAEYVERIEKDTDLQHLRDAHAKLGKDIESGLADATAEAAAQAQSVMEQASWFWHDMFSYYLPKAMSMMKNIPIPRTEYKDDDIEFVLENLDVSSLNIQPAHVFIRNITDVDMNLSETSTTTAVGTLTHIRMQALQLAFKDMSFWYKSKDTSLGPSEFSGLMATEAREARKGFHVIESVNVHVDEGVTLEVRDSNHAILFNVFKPVFLMRFRDALERTLTGQIRGMLTWADGLAFDVSKRAEVFGDAGLGTGAAYAGAVWSEIGRMRRAESSTAMRVTGTGFIIDSDGGSLAVGAEPQILSGDKHGPLATASDSLKDRARDAVGKAKDEVEARTGTEMDVDVDVEGAKNKAQSLLEEGKQQWQSFQQTVEQKAEQEKKKDGWKSSAFDV